MAPQSTAADTRDRDRLAAEVLRLREELTFVQQQIVATRDEAMLQEVGIYDYRHPAGASETHRRLLDENRARYKELARSGMAVRSHTSWAVEGDPAKGKKITRDIAKLMLRAYNAEVDDAVRAMKPYKLEASLARIQKAADAITRLGSSMGIAVTADYHRLRCYELELTADYLAKRAEEKELERAEKSRLREEEKAQRELQRERERLEKEAAHYRGAIERLVANGDETAAAEARAHLTALEEAIEGVDYWAANVRAGYVYVISNVGAFGPGVVKIGLTRRLEPMDRVRELGDASVPFGYDVHALIFSEDAVALETALHQRFAEQRVNLVNLRREFF